MKRNLLLIALSIIPLCASAAQVGEEARLLRFPATNGTEVVFSYAGDLYSVSIEGGEAHKLTSHIGYEIFPKYSPDGKTIAFTGEYDGNREVYLMNSEGGQPARLTWTSTNGRDDLGDRMGPNNIVMCWSPDGKNILYRNRIGDGFPGNLWSVSPDGQMPSKIPLPEGGFCCYSPDGKLLAYNRVMREFRTWKYYRGGMADDIWIWNPKKGSVENVTDNIAQDIFPMWIGDEIYFASDRDMTMNIFVYDTKTKKTTKVTDFHDYDVKFPSCGGNMIVFEQAGYVWKLDPVSKKYSKISVSLASDDIYARNEYKNVSSKVSSLSISPDGNRIVVTARGEVFNVPVEKGVVRNISRTPGANERSADWSPDGRSIVYISDRTGESELWLQDAGDELSAPRQLTKNNDTYIRSVQWSPDGKKILYTDRKNRVVEVDPVSGTKKVLLQNPESEFFGVNYSADSKWLTYTKPASNDMSVVYVFNIADNKEYPVTEKWYNSFAPTFSEDGKYLIFGSDRDFHPIYSRTEWNHAYTSMGGVYMAMLAKDTPSPLLPKDGVVNKKDKEKNPKDTTSKNGVRVDPDGLWSRIVRIPVEGSARNFYCDGKSLWFSSNRGTSVFDFATQKTDKCCDASVNYRFKDKKAVCFKGFKEVYTVPFPSKKIALSNPVDLSEMKAYVDYPQEWAQIFDEVWRAFRDGFYLENMHGRDWKAIKEKYAVLLPYVKTRLDLNYVIGEMIGELACGHCYVQTGDYPKPQRIAMGLLGAEMSKDKSGYFRIDRILEGAPYSEQLRSPLAEPGMNISKNEFITAIDGVSTKEVANIQQLLVGKAGKLTEITVNTKAEKGGRKVVVKPIADEYPLYHYEWVIGNIRKVDELSGGKVGYIYIPDMSAEGLNEFARYFYPQLDKEALIIDDRANGGGNVSPMIIERLMRQVYRMDMRRTSSRTSTTPDAAHTGPKVLLINKYSASDGDLFPWSFKANNLGTVIGTRTWGGIIGISGSLPYMDGTDVRVPFFTNYDAKSGEWIVENHGVDPDILLDNDPVKEAAGIDQQLEEAVRVALEQIKDRKPLPGVPAPRTFKDLGLPENW
ncbi:MAG: PD40 domain-containing protein [Bacteroidales bacterium]|nr:PD40 domain-containing protein [Candidatus Cacconaster equi]